MVKTVSDSQEEILKSIETLYCPFGFDCDPTYSTGVFYKNISSPRLRFDINPQIEGVQKACATKLPVESGSLLSIVFDPPFLHDAGKESLLGNRFSCFKTQHELRAFYFSAIVEFHRALAIRGLLVFKCQDIVADHKQNMNHCHIWNMALLLGFVDLDLFVLIAKQRIRGGNHEKQQHARKHHSYFWVFEKRKEREG